jgi:hypothetical protein
MSLYLYFYSLFFHCQKTLLDFNIFKSTGRLAGTPDWVKLALSKKEKLASTSSPNQRRILIISGSNGLFGISAEKISKATGIPTLNLSSHAGLGGEYVLNRSAPFIRAGDIILLPLEYPFYSSLGLSQDFKEHDLLARFLLSYDQKSFQSVAILSRLDFAFSNGFSLRNKKEYLRYFKGYLSQEDILERLQQDYLKGECYTSFSLNDYGDETCNIGKENAPVNPAIFVTAMPSSLIHIDPSGYIQKFVKFATDTGASIIPLYPVSTHTDDYQSPIYTQSAEKIKQFWEDQGIAFQDSLEDSLLPPKMMYNTNYHPKDEGREKRTKIIINLVKKQL